MAYLFLAVAIISEVVGTLSLRMAAEGRRIWYAGVGVGYIVALGLLSLTLAEGLPLGVVYGIWAAAGVALVAVLSKLLFNETFNGVMAVGIALICGGVLLVELGAGH